MMCPMTPRVTVRDLAKLAGVHFTTVSMALRNHPRIPAPTRNRIKKLAKKMGYRPDAMLNALSIYRQGTKKPCFQATIAWINAHPARETLYHTALYREYFRGARERAEELGYKLEEFWLGEPGLTQQRLGVILNSRGIQGALVAPLDSHSDMKTMDVVPWRKLSAVSLSFSLRHPQIHTVTASQYRGMRSSLHELRKLGYRRIGFLMDSDLDLRGDHNWQAAFWVDYHSQPREWRVEPFWSPSGQVPKKPFRKWLETQRPDVITPCGAYVADIVRDLGLKVPRDIGLAHHNVDSDIKAFSGMDQCGSRIGASALEYLVDMLNRQECGVPESPKQILIEGHWVRGKTVRKVGPDLSLTRE